jgi:hypothetical protein
MAELITTMVSRRRSETRDHSCIDPPRRGRSRRTRPMARVCAPDARIHPRATSSSTDMVVAMRSSSRGLRCVVRRGARVVLTICLRRLACRLISTLMSHILTSAGDGSELHSDRFALEVSSAPVGR